jgi:hypothetical protein
LDVYKVVQPIHGVERTANGVLQIATIPVGTVLNVSLTRAFVTDGDLETVQMRYDGRILNVLRADLQERAVRVEGDGS